jgi:hypothetical protein
MNNIEQSDVIIKSNVTLKSRGVVPPIDNMSKEYFDVRMDSALTQEQRALKIKMLFWAKEIYDKNRNPIQDECYKGCQNCGEVNNHCKRPQNVNITRL